MRDYQRWARVARQRGIVAVLIALFVFVGSALPALAAGAVQDDGNLFSAGARTNAENKIAQIQRDTGKTVAVKTVPNLGGKNISAVADQYASQQKLNGVLIYAARDEKKLQLKVGVDTRAAVTTAEETAIRDQMTKSFAANDFDGGLLTAIDRFGADLRAAPPARNGSSQPAGAPATATTKSSSGFPVLLGVLLVVVVIAVVLMVVLRRNRTPSGPSGGANYGPQGGYPPQGGYGPGYGPGYGQQGGGGSNIGGSILGGAAGGIGGAIVGNAIYDHFRDANQDNRDRTSAGDYGSGSNEPQLGNDQGHMDDSPADSGSWDSGGSGSDPGTGDWGSGGDTGGGDPGSD